MKKWQEERNYRRVRNEGGEVIANIVVRLVAPFHTERSPIWTLSEKIVFTQGSR